jgi:hypothetical protein
VTASRPTRGQRTVPTTFLDVLRARAAARRGELDLRGWARAHEEGLRAGVEVYELAADPHVRRRAGELRAVLRESGVRP